MTVIKWSWEYHSINRQIRALHSRHMQNWESWRRSRLTWVANSTSCFLTPIYVNPTFKIRLKLRTSLRSNHIACHKSFLTLRDPRLLSRKIRNPFTVLKYTRISKYVWWRNAFYLYNNDFMTMLNHFGKFLLYNGLKLLPKYSTKTVHRQFLKEWCC